MNPRMLVEFVDGSKTMVEMCAIANATGLVPDVPGMHGPKADRDELAKVLIPREDGGLLAKKGVVDYTIGKGVAPGVFVIVEATHPRIIERMDDLHVGKGPYYSLLPALPSDLAGSAADRRPHHALRQARHGAAADAGRRSLRASPSAISPPARPSMRSARPATARWTMTAADARGQRAVPVGLLEGGKVLKPVRKGELLTTATPRRPDDQAVRPAKIAG